MRININQIDKFKKFRYGYMFMVKRGLFLLFDIDTLEYKGLYEFIPYGKETNKEIDEVINRLVALNYLEV